ncbi:hypothetical protein [Thermococcus siculi]|nr:hypothetical protein [Thermococcus siculi]
MAVAVTVTILLGIGVLLMSVPKIDYFAHKLHHTHVLEDWSRDEED